MDIQTLGTDKKVFYVTATSYPEGILDAHRKLHALLPFSADRKYFGISRPENGTIVYRAATEEQSPGEAEKYQCDTLILKKGKYISLLVDDFKEHPQRIEIAFQKLLLNPDLDPQGYCVELYLNDKEAVECMIRLNE